MATILENNQQPDGFVVILGVGSTMGGVEKECIYQIRRSHEILYRYNEFSEIKDAYSYDFIDEITTNHL